MSFLNKIKRLSYFFFIAVRKRKKDLFQMLGMLTFLITMAYIDASETGLFYYFIIGFISIILLVYLYTITKIEIMLYDANKLANIQFFVTDMLYDIYDKVSDGESIASFTLYISQEIYDIIKVLDFFDKFNIVVERNRHGKSYGFTPKHEVITDVDNFFELDDKNDNM